jgi:maltooligosyltrehalose trehalohydrolase
VVYNHLGPTGAPHDEFGPYRTTRYATPWGSAMNLDGPESDAVRDYFIEHALYLIDDLGIDGLRLDAIHAIADSSEVPFVAELAAAVHERADTLGRLVTVVAESAADDARVTTPLARNGLGCDAQWDDDFHHALRVACTGDRGGYLADIEGLGDLATALRTAFVRPGAYSRVHRRRHGRAPESPLDGTAYVVYAQNHDQIGNTGFGERLAVTLGADSGYLLAALVLLAPYVPLRFMGEEYGETSPFHFFTSFGEGELAEAIRRGRAGEIGTAGRSVPDPEDEATFVASRLVRSRRLEPDGVALRAFQRRLLELRRAEPALSSLRPSDVRTEVNEDLGVLAFVRPAATSDGTDVLVCGHLRVGSVAIELDLLSQAREARVLLAHRGEFGAPDEVVLGDFGVAVIGLDRRA